MKRKIYDQLCKSKDAFPIEEKVKNLISKLSYCDKVKENRGGSNKDIPEIEEFQSRRGFK